MMTGDIAELGMVFTNIRVKGLWHSGISFQDSLAQEPATIGLSRQVAETLWRAAHTVYGGNSIDADRTRGPGMMEVVYEGLSMSEPPGRDAASKSKS